VQITNSSIMFVAVSLGSGGSEMSNAEEWARSLGEEIKAKQSAAREDAQTVAMHRDIVAEKMPFKWEELCAVFQSCCTAYNEQLQPERKLACHRSGSHRFSICPDALPEIVEGTYHYETKRIHIQTPGASEWFLPHVVLTGSGDVELVSNSTRKVKTIEKIAQDAIREGLIRR